MAERGAVPQVSAGRRRVLGMIRSFTSPLLPDDYLELVNPLWSTRELRGRIERIERETAEAVTVLIKPGWEWPGHRPGQYLRLGIEVDGIHHWRAYSLTSDPRRSDGCISITPKLVEQGKVSPFLFNGVRPGAIVRLGGVEGTFVLPDPLPERLLFISAGSGITPIMSMLRSLAGEDRLRDVVHVHSARSADRVIFGEELRRLDARHAGYRLHEQRTGEQGRVTAAHLDELCPDWRERETFLSGPRELMDAVEELYEKEDRAEHLHTERFQPVIGVGGGDGDGGTVVFRVSDCEAKCESGVSILVGGEEAGATLPFGCRMGICHTCVGRLRDGAVRDLRTGAVTEANGQMVRTCINAPEGRIEIDL
jgi:ferredoxin-NADP reductase